MIELILGGARSGKSTLAEQRALASGLAVSYIATADTSRNDAEMAARIAHHRARRPAQWALLEEPLALAALLQTQAAPNRLLLVDCLTLWLTNLMLLGDEARLEAELNAFYTALPDLPGRVLFISNEVGNGGVPMNALARRFGDEQGWLNQRVAQLANRVTLVVAGLPLEIKQT